MAIEQTAKKRNWDEIARIGLSWLFVAISAVMMVLGFADLAVTGSVSGGLISGLTFNAVMLLFLNGSRRSA